MDTPLKIGIWLPRGYSPKVGGGFSYVERLIEEVDQFDFDKRLEIVFISEEKDKYDLKKEIVKVVHPKEHFKTFLLGKIIGLFSRLSFLFGKGIVRWMQKKYYQPLHSRLIKRDLLKEEVKIIYYPLQQTSVVNDFPFIATYWDMGHLTTHAFPEMHHKGGFEAREFFLRKQLPKALAIFTESKTGKEELIRITGLFAERIKVLPIFPGKVADLTVTSEAQESILSELGLEKENYFFYPAQFWPHKNHTLLLKAFKQLLSNNNQFIYLVLTGSDKGNRKYIESLIDQLALREQVIFPGFVSMETLHTLYKNAIALVMPTFLGPTNMPPLEARKLACPVLCSDLPGHREQMGEGAFYFDPLSESELLNQMKKVMIKTERDYLIAKANKELELSSFTSEVSGSLLQDYFLELLSIRQTWN